MAENNNNIQSEALVLFAKEYIKETKRKRRWSILLRILFLAWLTTFIIVLYPSKDSKKALTTKDHTALISIRGEISDKSNASANKIVTALHRAYKNKFAKGIILRINSPGGSPVQSDYIFSEIMRLKKKYPEKKIYAVCVDACASAAYYIASATDKIYANQASLIGSIGVIYNGFGFVGIMDKVGIERRAFTAGKNKAFMDPFAPVKPEQKAQLEKMLNQLHDLFIEDVKKGRGKRLANDPALFSGLYWSGVKAKELGLIDDYGSAGTVARNVIKAKKIVNYTVKPPLLERFAKRLGASLNLLLNPFAENKMTTPASFFK